MLAGESICYFFSLELAGFDSVFVSLLLSDFDSDFDSEDDETSVPDLPPEPGFLA
jgi:hypothetical protein